MNDAPRAHPVDRLLGAGTAAALYRPTGEAVGLPGRAYVDPAFFAEEQRTLFRRSWVIVGHESEIAQPGDAMPVNLAGQPLILLRDREGQVRAYHNICRHRGMRLLAEPCRGAAVIRCPWHSWAYDLGGRLMATPNIEGVGCNESTDFPREKLSLIEVRSAIWLGQIFVNLDGQAPALADYLAPALRYFAAYDLSCLAFGGSANREIGANWKLCIEGGIEDYHLPWVHPQFFEGVPGWSAKSIGEAHFVGTESRFDLRAEAFSERNGLPPFPNLDPDRLRTGYFTLLFPTLGLAAAPTHFAMTHYRPLGVDRTYYRKDYYFVGAAASDPALERARRGVIENWFAVNDQDQAIVEALHQNHRARDAAGIDNRFTPAWEGAVQRFQQLVVESLV